MKLRSLLLIIICITLFAGCAKKADDTKGNTSPTQTAKVTQPASATQAPAQAGTADTKAGQSTTDSKSTAKSGQSTVKSDQKTTQPSDKAAATTSTKKTTIRVAALKGPTAIGMVKMMDDTSSNYKFTIAGTPDQISAGIVKGDYDVAAIPCNLASVLYNKTHKIQIAGINTLGVLYIVETGHSINSVKDLKGKTIYSTGLGSTPQYTLNYILAGNRINPKKDVKVIYKSEATEVASILSKSNNAIAMLPQPYVSAVMMQNKKVHISLIVADEWEKISKGNSTVVTGVVVVNKDFLKKHKAAFDSFMREYTASTDYVNTYTAMAAKLVQKHGLFKAAPAEKAIPYCNITMIMGTNMVNKVRGYLNEIYKWNPASIGGKLPDDKCFYYPNM